HQLSPLILRQHDRHGRRTPTRHSRRLAASKQNPQNFRRDTLVPRPAMFASWVVLCWEGDGTPNAEQTRLISISNRDVACRPGAAGGTAAPAVAGAARCG